MTTNYDALPDQAKEVFLAHGWDVHVIGQLKKVLKDIGLRVVEWEELVARLQKPSPFTLEVVKKALDDNMVCVVLFTPDETIAPSKHIDDLLPDGSPHRLQEFQARPNVLIEAGMAFATNLDRTVIIQVGQHRQISDLDGLNVVRTQDEEWAHRLAQRLRIAFEQKGQTLPLSQRRLNSLKKIPPIERPEAAINRPSSVEDRAVVPSVSPTIGSLSSYVLTLDPVRRRERLLEVFQQYGGPTSDRWRFDQNAPDYKVMKEAEAEDVRNPLAVGTRVYVQQHYESEYNGNVGSVVSIARQPTYSVEFESQTGLARKKFHVMYLSRCK